MGDSTKKFETWSVSPPHYSGAPDTREGEEVEVKIVTSHRGGSATGFRACFADGHKIDDTDIESLRTKAREYVLQKRGWVWERMIKVETNNGFRFRGHEDGRSAELVVAYELLDKVKGQDIYYDLTHTHKTYTGAQDVFILWTQEREDALRAIIARIEQAYEDLRGLLGESQMAAQMLDTAAITKLLPPKEESE